MSTVSRIARILRRYGLTVRLVAVLGIVVVAGAAATLLGILAVPTAQAQSSDLLFGSSAIPFGSSAGVDVTGTESAPRDELAIKLALAVTTPGVDVLRVVQTQRTATMTGLQELTRLKTRVPDDVELAWSLVLDSLVFRAEAEIRWLDHCEARVARAAAERRSAAPEQPAPATAPMPSGKCGRR